MPFYVHVKDAEPETGDRYFTRTDALQGFDGRTHKITYVSDDSDFLDWTSRERGRIQDGEYIGTPWADRDAYTLHFAHMSLKQPGMIAFTRDYENGYLDKQTIIKPGKYLTEYYADIFTPAEIATYIAKCTSANTELKIATSPDDIQKVYENGPRSCMAHTFGAHSYRDCRCCQTSDESGSHYTYASSEHPVRVYGDSDLAVAYYGDINGKVSARAVIWPEKKIYSRVYGATAVLTRLLESAGYESGDVTGACVRAIAEQGTYILPYIDNISSAAIVRRNYREWIELGKFDRHSSYSLDCSNTNGLGGEVEQDEENTFYCDSCNGTFDDDHYGGDGMCNDCYAENFSNCAGCSDSFHNDRLTESGTGEMYCTRCYRNAAEDCEVCGDSFNPLEFSHGKIDDRRRNNLEHVCSDCETTHDYCGTCETYYAVDGSDDVHAPDAIARVEFPGTDVNVSGIYPADLVPAVDTDNPLRMTCSECERTYVRCDRTESLIAEIDRMIGLENLAIAAEQERVRLAEEKRQAEYREANGIQFVTVYRWTHGYGEYRRYRAFEYSQSGLWRFPYANHGEQFALTSELEAIDSAFARLRDADRTAAGIVPAPVFPLTVYRQVASLPEYLQKTAVSITGAIIRTGSYVPIVGNLPTLETLSAYISHTDAGWIAERTCSGCAATVPGDVCQTCDVPVPPPVEVNSAGGGIDAGEVFPMVIYRRSAIVPAEYWRIVHTTPEQRTHAYRETWHYVERLHLFPAEVSAHA